MTTRLALTAALAACALLAAGCGSSDNSDTTPTTEWANGLCTSITTWKTEITSIVDSLKGGNLSQDSLAAAVDDADEATRNFTSSLKSLGRPDTEADLGGDHERAQIERRFCGTGHPVPISGDQRTQ